MIQRGEIWWADLPEPHGAEPGFRRPILVVQSDDFTGLSKDSVANISQVITIDKYFLTECVGSLPSKHFKKIQDGLRLVLSL